MPTRLFDREPNAKVANLSDLVGIAYALEREAAVRYADLAIEMERLGETAAAATFRELLAEEKGHIGAVARWAEDLGQAVPPSSDFARRLPPELDESWEDAVGSALLTPYRALSIAVLNEQRAFSLYAYIAANAADPEVAREAERLAKEELAHAALLRRKRRLAYRREHPERQTAVPTAIETMGDFRTLVRRLEGDAAGIHAGLVRRLEAAGDMTAAKLLAEIARRESRAAGGELPRSAGSQKEPPAGSLQCLHRALEPLERMAEVYEHLAESAPSEAILTAAQDALTDVIARIAAITTLARRQGR